MKSEDFSTDCPGKIVSIGPDFIAFVPSSLPPSLQLSETVRGLHEQALLGIGELRAIIPFLPNPQLITRPFLHREAVLSSRIEGTWTQLEQLYLFEASDPKSRRGESADVQDAREVLNYVEALEHGLQSLPQLPVCHRLIKEMHGILMKDVRGNASSPGKYRTCQNFIGASRDLASAKFVPPPPLEMNLAIDELEKYIHSADGLPTLVRIALIHYQFEAIHPFEDGNGRIGRLLIVLLLASYGLISQPLLYLSAAFERKRDEYYRLLLAVSQRGAWDEWITYFLQATISEAQDAVGRARGLLDLREEWRATVQTEGFAASVLQLVDSLFQTPIVSIPQAKALLGMTFRSAQLNVHKLVDKGYLTEVTGQQRNRLYLAKPISKILTADRWSPK
jgi:Fic family protein